MKKQKFNLTFLTSIFFVLAAGPFSASWAQGQKATKKQSANIETPDNVQIVEEPTSSGSAEGSKPTSGLRFKTDGESESKETRAPMKFKALGSEEGKDVVIGTSSPEELKNVDDDVFKINIGYPKHRAGLFVAPQDFSAKWSYNSQDFNFDLTLVQYGFNYTFIATPLLQFELEYTRYSASIDAATVSPFSVIDSEKNYDSLFVNTRFCFVRESSFLKRLCPAFVVGKDAYPILGFVDSVRLQMDRVNDVVFGGLVTYQQPITAWVSLDTTLGYNMGTGVGNSGQLTSKSNSSLYLTMAADWSFKENHSANLGLSYLSRTAELEGKIGSNKIKWETESSQLGLKAAYNYTF